MQLTGKVAIVTGGGGGLGRALVEALLKRGSKVYIFDVNTKRGEEVANSLQTKFGADRVCFQLCDVANDKSFTDAFQAAVIQHGNVDIMVNNAALIDERIDIDRMLLVNLGGTIRGTNLAIKHMRKDEGGKGGVIINICSISAWAPSKSLPSYTSTKHGVCGFTRSWAENPYLNQMGLRFGQLCPGGFDSFIIKDIEKQMLYGLEHAQVLEDLRTSGEYQKAEDIAAGLIEVLEDDDSNGVMFYPDAKGGGHRKTIRVVNET